MAIPKVDEKYETGQFFLHRVFGYRGVILFPWRAKIYDRNTYVSPYADSAIEENPTANATETESTTSTTTTATKPSKSEESGASGAGAKQKNQSTRKIDTDTDSIRNDGKKEVTVDVQTYYQVLIDSRDCPHVVRLFECGFFVSFHVFSYLCLFIISCHFSIDIHFSSKSLLSVDNKSI